MNRNIVKQSYLFVSLLTFFVTFIFSYSIGELFYNSVDGTDFSRYLSYIEYFRGEIDSPLREQGLFYFWVISLFIKFSYSFNISDDWEFIYSTGIQLGNNLFYAVGVFGLIYLLRLKKTSWEKIFLSCSLLNLFPPVFGGRLIMKPEILIFAILPWIIVAIESYFKSRNNAKTIFASILLSIVVTSKGTSALICIVAILFIYFPKIKLLKIKDLTFPLIVFLLSFYLLNSENYFINNINLFNHQEEDSYLFKAPLSFIYNINFSDLYYNPYRNYHADSLIGITLIDLFNDYFNRYWNHPRSLFLLDKYEPNLRIEYPRRILSIILSILFIYFSLKKITKFKSLYLVGVFVLTLTSFGVFGLHFNPLKGDTLKTHYYFFLIGISFVFIVVDLIRSSNFWKNYAKIFFLIFTFIFIFGFPKNYTSQSELQILEKIPNTISCNYSKQYFNIIFSADIECTKNRKLSICGNLETFNQPKVDEDGYLIFISDSNFLPLNLINQNGQVVTVRGLAECMHYVEGDYYPNNIDFVSNDRTPRVNNIFIYLVILSIIGIIYSCREKKDYSSSG